jgi:hypothetical protein
MARIPTHTIEDAPAAARPLLAEMIQFPTTGRLLNMHAQRAHAPAVLEAYIPIRKATARRGTLDQRDRTALMLATAADARPGALAIITALALLAGRDTGEGKLDTLPAVVRGAAANSGRVSNPTRQAAACRGGDNEQLAEAFAYLGPAVFTSYFLNYAATEPDVPATPARAGEGA